MDPDRRFGTMTVAWMRKQMGLRTLYFPEQAPLPDHGIGRFEAWRYASTTWGDIAYVAFVSICLGAAVMMFGMRAPVRADAGLSWGAWANMVGLALLGLGAVGLIAAWRSWRASRRPVLVLTVDDPVAADVPRIEPLLAELASDALRRPATQHDREVWIVAGSGFTPGALQLALDRSLRCFSCETGSILERARSAPPPGAPPRAA